MSPEDQARVRRLLAERVGVRAIARATGRARSWVQGFVNTVYREHTPHDPGPPPTRPDPVVIGADERWSLVGSKGDVQWVWVALDAGTRRVLGMVVGDRPGLRSVVALPLLWVAARDPAHADQPLDPVLVTLAVHSRTGVKVRGPVVTVAAFDHMAARLGGYRGHVRKKPPGWQTRWHGWNRLNLMAQGARAALEIVTCDHSEGGSPGRHTGCAKHASNWRNS